MLKKSIRIVAISLLALGASFLHFSNIFATKSYPAQSQEFYVNDLANVINDDTEQYIIDTNKALAAQTGGQVVVMTVESLDGEAIEDYAHGVFEQYGIGSSDKNNGTLILLSVGDRQSRIELGRGPEGFITDAGSGRIQDNFMIPDFKENNWNDGLRKGYDAILAYYEKEYETDISESAVEELTDSDRTSTYESILFFGLFTLCFMSAKFFKRIKIAKTALSILGISSTAVGLMLSNVIGTTVATYLLTIGLGLLMGIFFEFGFIGSSSGYHGGGWSSGGSGGGSHGGGGHSSGGGSSRSF